MKNRNILIGVIYIIALILAVYAPIIAKNAVISFGLGIPFLCAVLTIIYVPNERLKAGFLVFIFVEAIVLVLAVTGYGATIIDLFVEMAAIVRCFAGIFLVGLPGFFVFRFANGKGWIRQAEEAADKAVKNHLK